MRQPPPVSAALWQQRYEALRQHVVERSQILGSDPLGLVVLFTRGLAGWMQSWWEAPAEPSTTSAPRPSLGGPATPQWQEQLTHLLAHMTAQHL
jgi:hypothetical protein